MENISNLQDNLFGMSVISMPKFHDLSYNIIFVSSYKATPKTENHKSIMW